MSGILRGISAALLATALVLLGGLFWTAANLGGINMSLLVDVGVVVSCLAGGFWAGKETKQWLSGAVAGVGYVLIGVLILALFLPVSGIGMLEVLLEGGGIGVVGGALGAGFYRGNAGKRQSLGGWGRTSSDRAYSSYGAYREKNYGDKTYGESDYGGKEYGAGDYSAENFSAGGYGDSPHGDWDYGPKGNGGEDAGGGSYPGQDYSGRSYAEMAYDESDSADRVKESERWIGLAQDGDERGYPLYPAAELDRGGKTSGRPQAGEKKEKSGWNGSAPWWDEPMNRMDIGGKH